MLPDNPLIVQSDRTLMLHTVRTLVDDSGAPIRNAQGQPMTEEHPRFIEARDALATFAELEKSPDYLHTYRITAVSVWNAAALKVSAATIRQTLEEFSCVPIPQNVLDEISGWVARYGILRIERDGESFRLTSRDPECLSDVLGHQGIRKLVTVDDSGAVWVDALQRGDIKQALIKIGFPVEDLGGYVDGDPFEVRMREVSRNGLPFRVRDYQQQAADAFHAGGKLIGGSGVIVLPCGAGKTVTAMSAMSQVGAKTLILTTNTIAVRQWREELLDKTHVSEEDVGEYTGEQKDIRPVTISTYQMLTWRRNKSEEFPHFAVFGKENWGLVIYDEVHLLPAPIFRATAALQARRRLGLTATLVREDDKEDEVFSLIGPKRFDMPWKVLEAQGFIASASCVEVRVPLHPDIKATYIAAGSRSKFRLSSENPAKTPIVKELCRRHRDDRVLVIGQYIDQLKALSRHLGAPLITGKTPTSDRERLYAAFSSGEEPLLIVSKVGNFAVDLPGANVAIQVSGTFGSRQEEAQRLGRILRPKRDGSSAIFYSVVTGATKDQEFAEHRQLFLTEQGYTYTIMEAERFVKGLVSGAET